MKSGMQDCYEAAGRLISTKPMSALLVHGEIYSTKLHRRIKHAWVEHNAIVYDFSNGKRWKIKVEDYYREGMVHIVAIYSRAAALKMLQETGRFEFWSDEQRAKVLGVNV